MITPTLPGNERTIADAGVLIQSKRDSKEGLRLRIEILSKHGPDQIRASLELLDRDRLILANQPSSFQSKVRLKRGYWTPPNEAIKRVIEGLGGGSLYYGNCVFEVPEPWRRKATFVGFRIGPVDDRIGGTPDLYLERNSSQFGLTRTSRHTAFLLSSSQIDNQIQKIAERYQMVQPGEAGTNALTNLMFKMLGGYDTPLIWDEGDEERE